MNKRSVGIALFITIFICVIAFVLISVFFSGCNAQIVDTTYTFNYAWIDIPGGDHVEGKVQSWRDYEDGDQIQVKIDGVTYLTDTTRCVLASNYKEKK